ncbi:microsomal epoxide hydrolase [Xylaria telfairii]|nr:microsomal epoxide hydrolase [Xylaria telfairii]
MSSIKSFKIAIPDSELADLKDRLLRPRYQDEPKDVGRERGVPLADVKRIAKYWATTFNWRKAESALNQFPQFMTDIAAAGFDPVTVHFVHVKSTAKGAMPLMFVHGWPGSFLEGTKLIAPLTEGTPAFDIVIPSLPNFGFSAGIPRAGFSVDQHAEVLHKLMLRLGYDSYVTQGGDWGAFITRAMASAYGPRHLKAQHLNLGFYSFPSFRRTPSLFVQAMLTPFTAKEKAGLAKTGKFFAEGNGCGAIQSTRPQTLGYGLTDSPAGLLAWVYEKLHDWADEYPWTEEEICTWASIYWFSTAGPAASTRLYYEFQQDIMTTIERLRGWMDVKVGFGQFPNDVTTLPRLWAKQLGPTVFQREHPDGGHFPAWEKPEYVVADLREMFGRVGGAEDVVKDTNLL